jgi:hypothetical protein
MSRNPANPVVVSNPIWKVDAHQDRGQRQRQGGDLAAELADCLAEPQTSEAGLAHQRATQPLCDELPQPRRGHWLSVAD